MQPCWDNSDGNFLVLSLPKTSYYEMCGMLRPQRPVLKLNIPLTLTICQVAFLVPD